MSPIAAYALFIATDAERAPRHPRYTAPVPRTIALERLVEALERFISLGRPMTTRPT